MPGGAHDVRAQDCAVGKRLLDVVVGHAWQAQAECPFGGRVVLRLDSAKPLHESFWRFECPPGDVLVVKPLVRNVQLGHSPFVSSSVRYLVMIVCESLSNHIIQKGQKQSFFKKTLAVI